MDKQSKVTFDPKECNVKTPCDVCTMRNCCRIGLSILKYAEGRKNE